MRNTVRKVATSIALLASLGAASTALAAPATADTSTRALCGTQNWDGKNPAECGGLYRVYDLTSGAHGGTILFEINNTNYAANQAGAWEAVKGGYGAAQDWCGDNSLTCALVTAVGVAIVSPLLTASS